MRNHWLDVIVDCSSRVSFNSRTERTKPYWFRRSSSIYERFMPPCLLHPEQGPWTSLREEKGTPNMSSIHGGLLMGPLEGVLTVYL